MRPWLPILSGVDGEQPDGEVCEDTISEAGGSAQEGEWKAEESDEDGGDVIELAELEEEMKEGGEEDNGVK